MAHLTKSISLEEVTIEDTSFNGNSVFVKYETKGRKLSGLMGTFSLPIKIDHLLFANSKLLCNKSERFITSTFFQDHLIIRRCYLHLNKILYFLLTLFFAF